MNFRNVFGIIHFDKLVTYIHLGYLIFGFTKKISLCIIVCVFYTITEY